MNLNIYQIYMIIFVLTYFGLVIGVRSILLYRKIKIDATKNFGKESKVKNAERIIQIALFIMMITAINYSFLPANYKYFLPIEFMEKGWFQTAGFILSMLGLIGTFIAQLQMKDSWRLGIDNHEEIELVTTKLFSISRNPIYLALGISFLGFFMIAPNVISILFLIVMFYGVNQKIKDEEDFLLNKFGSRYEMYKAEVRKWI